MSKRRSALRALQNIDGRFLYQAYQRSKQRNPELHHPSTMGRQSGNYDLRDPEQQDFLTWLTCLDSVLRDTQLRNLVVQQAIQQQQGTGSTAEAIGGYTPINAAGISMGVQGSQGQQQLSFTRKLPQNIQQVLPNISRRRTQAA